MKGWFHIPGVQDGDRTVDEQMRGLDRALALARGATVLDLGAAEGAIGERFVAAGAERVDGIEYNEDFLALHADRVTKATQGRMSLRRWDLNDGLPHWAAEEYDIVLALAILHKLDWPSRMLDAVAGVSAGLLVIRLPVHGANGVIRSKYVPERVTDLTLELTMRGFTLIATEPGPRKEPVQYWQRA